MKNNNSFPCRRSLQRGFHGIKALSDFHLPSIPLKNYEGKVSTDIDNTSFAITAFLCPKTLEPGRTGDCYTVIIRGERKYLFFKRNLRMYDHRIGRWWVEVES